MCITANFTDISGTYINVVTSDDKHECIYQNQIDIPGSKNAMILPVPTYDTLLEFEVYEKNYVSGIWNKWFNMRSVGMSKSLNYQRVGSYDVYNTSNLYKLDTICHQQGVILTKKMINWFHETYPDWQFVIAFFNPETANQAMHPFSWKYTPIEKYKKLAFFPLVEAHGIVPERIKLQPHQKCLINGIPINWHNSSMTTTNEDLWAKYSDIRNVMSIKKLYDLKLFDVKFPNELRI